MKNRKAFNKIKFEIDDVFYNWEKGKLTKRQSVKYLLDLCKYYFKKYAR